MQTSRGVYGRRYQHRRLPLRPDKFGFRHNRARRIAEFVSDDRRGNPGCLPGHQGSVQGAISEFKSH